MKRIIFILLICCFSCQNKEQQEENPETKEKTKSDTLQGEICYLATGKDIQTENTILRDSTILNLEIEGEKVTGILNWIPAEKDGRRGKITATKSGDLITGKYSFTQEGMEETQPIEIQLYENLASITTNSGAVGEMNLSASKVNCSN